MGIREVSIYTCDGCGATATLDKNTRARGWHTIKVDGSRVERLVCTICYGAVEWVIKFQGITVPPKAHKGPDGRYRLRQVSREELPPAPVEEEDDFLLDDDEDEE